MSCMYVYIYIYTHIHIGQGLFKNQYVFLVVEGLVWVGGGISTTSKFKSANSSLLLAFQLYNYHIITIHILFTITK